MYVEDLKRGTNKDIGPKDIFEIGSLLCQRPLRIERPIIIQVGNLRTSFQECQSLFVKIGLNEVQNRSRFRRKIT